jgi:putative spermidine/putrescine transport system permease protein
MANEPVQDVLPTAITGLPLYTPHLSRPLRVASLWSTLLFYIVIGFFVLNLFGLIGTVLLDSLGQQWFSTWLPQGLFTSQWYSYELADHDLGALLFNTFTMAVITTLISLLVGFPAAYVLARKQFRFKGILLALYLVPMMVPPLAYGIPLATVLLTYLGGGLPSVILINVVPTLPFVILILMPFIEQVDVSLEAASRMLGAKPWQTFWRIILPLVVPGLLTAGVLTIVRAIAMFELTFLVADATATTLVVTLYGDAFGAGARPEQAINAMAVIYMLTTMILLGIALIFVKPTQFVVRLKER